MTETARMYGGSLYDLAAEEGLDERILGELDGVTALLNGDAEYLHLLSIPSIPKKERCALLDEAFRGQVHLYVLNFMKLLCEKGGAYYCFCQKGDEEDAEHTDDDSFLRMIADRIHETGKNILFLFRSFFRQLFFLDRLDFLSPKVIRPLTDNRTGTIGVDKALRQAKFRHHLANRLEAVVGILGHGL